MSVRTYLYDPEGHDREVELSPEMLDSLKGQRLLWIDVDGRDFAALKQLARHLGLASTIIARRRGWI